MTGDHLPRKEGEPVVFTAQDMRVNPSKDGKMTLTFQCHGTSIGVMADTVLLLEKWPDILAKARRD